MVSDRNCDFERYVADNSMNYCSNDLKKLPDVVQSTDKRSLELKKYSLNSFVNKPSIFTFRLPYLEILSFFKNISLNYFHRRKICRNKYQNNY